MRPRMRRVIADLIDADFQSWSDYRLEAWVDVVVASCEVGRCKPDPEIYRICLERLGLAADPTLFVDDRMENLQAARALD
jgi:putative hydrolase of the HAD superfamily